MEKRTYPLSPDGYVTTWLISGRADTPIDPSTRTVVGQGEYESLMRKTLHDSEMTAPPENICFGSAGLPDCPWSIYPSGPSTFVDVSKFYFVMYRIEFWIATSIISPRDQTVDASIWSYPSFDAWMNGELIATDTLCGYSPMRCTKARLKLKKGENLFFLRAQQVGTRDTRSIVALAFPGNPDIKAAYPGSDTESVEKQRAAVDWLYSIAWNGERLLAPSDIPEGVTLKIRGRTQKGHIYEIPEGIGAFRLEMDAFGLKHLRTIELPERIAPPKKAESSSPADAQRAFLKSLSARTVPSDNENPQLFYTTYIRLLHGYEMDEEDKRILNIALDEVTVQKDCSDFRFCYILALVLKGVFKGELKEKIKNIALNYAYWLDERAIGAMCFGSENHSLLFHVCQLLAGRLWQDEVFTASGRKGCEQEKIARARIDAWVKEVEESGYLEFLSGSYFPITVAAILLVIDFADSELSSRAVKILDEIFYSMAYNTFDGIIYAPQGRVYRTVLTPWSSGTQALIYFSTGCGVPSGEGALGSWLAAFADTKYKVPDNLRDIMQKTGMFYTKAKGTTVQTYKGKNYMLTSLPIEIKDGKPCSRYVAGSLAYQQHLSYATLGAQCFVFPTHPGGPFDGVAIRPGYWFGNGYFPAQKQVNNLLCQVFPLDEKHPINFTHLYFPTRCFDAWEQDGEWLFGKRGDGYIAVWCSNTLTAYDGDIVQGAEFRASAGAAAYLTVCGDTEAHGDLEGFKRYAKSLSPVFDREALLLSAGEITVGGEFAPEDSPLRRHHTV